MNVTDLLQQTLQNPVLQYFFYFPLLLILGDIITGIMAAVETRQFALKRIGTFLSGDLLKYAGASFLVVLAYLIFGAIQATTVATTVGMGTLVLHIGASIRSNILEIKNGAPPAAVPLISAAESEVTPLVNAVETALAAPPPDSAYAGIGTQIVKGVALPPLSVSVDPNAQKMANNLGYPPKDPKLSLPPKRPAAGFQTQITPASTESDNPMVQTAPLPTPSNLTSIFRSGASSVNTPYGNSMSSLNLANNPTNMLNGGSGPVTPQPNFPDAL